MKRSNHVLFPAKHRDSLRRAKQIASFGGMVATLAVSASCFVDPAPERETASGTSMTATSDSTSETTSGEMTVDPTLSGTEGTDPTETTMSPTTSPTTGPTTTSGCEDGQLGCFCDKGSECEDPLFCEKGVCVAQGCGNGELDDGEECDDGNAVDGDGCNVDCVISGQELWTYTLNGLLNDGDAATALAIGGEGSIYVAGKIVNESDDDVWVAKLDPDGELLWASTYAGEGGGDDRAEGIALLGDNVFVAGQLNVGNGADAFLLGMDAKTGEALGAPEVYDFSDGGPDIFQDLVASPSNELILVGSSGTPGQEYPLIAFASGDGVVSDWVNYADDGVGSLYDITLAGDHAIVCGNQGSFIQQVAIVRTLDAATGEPIGDSETFFPGAGWLYTGFKCLLTEDDTALVIAGGIHLEDTTFDQHLLRHAYSSQTGNYQPIDASTTSFLAGYALTRDPATGDVVTAGHGSSNGDATGLFVRRAAEDDFSNGERWHYETGSGGQAGSGVADLAIAPSGQIVAAGFIDAGDEGQNIWVAAFTP